MTIGSILLGVALLVVVGLFLARPFLMPEEVGTEEAPLSQREALALQKEVVLGKIRELDFDHETGKVPPAEYETLRERYLAEAAQILKALDALAPAEERVAAEGDMEAAIARLRQPAPTRAPAGGDGDDIEAAVARLRRQQVKATVNGGPAVASKSARRTGFCSQCGEAREEEDKFCAACGHAFT